MATLTFNKVHTNGWLSYRIAGVPGAVFVDKRMFTPESVDGIMANPPATIEMNDFNFAQPGADATAKAAEKAAKIAEREAKKIERANASAAKAQAKLEKLQETARKAQETVDKARAKAAGEVPAQ